MRWDDEEVRLLKTMWDTGLSMSLIGKHFGRCKNSISGAANRLGLPKRPELQARLTPARREMIVMMIQDGYNNNYIVKKTGSHRLTVEGVREQLSLSLPEPAKPLPACIVPVPFVAVGPARTCQWVTGERYAQTKCGEKSVFGKSWCCTHMSVVYVSRREAVAA